jgi:hypothetical protein
MENEMTNAKTGGPAFPALPISRELNGELVYQAEGITIRDYFAAKAMHAFIASGDLPKHVRDEELAYSAYQLADAMLEARK